MAPSSSSIITIHISQRPPLIPGPRTTTTTTTTTTITITEVDQEEHLDSHLRILIALFEGCEV